jgi:hypothetical protein
MKNPISPTREAAPDLADDPADDLDRPSQDGDAPDHGEDQHGGDQDFLDPLLVLGCET